jgi:YHS domain-containing protein
MSWKLSTLAIATFGLVAWSLAAGGQGAPWKDAGPRNDSPAASAVGGPLAATMQTDQELIDEQKTCPVTDEPLGSMGKPVKVTYKGRRIFLCCAGCKKKFRADPEKYLKKLDDKK